ncbi:hypothetical protein GWI33_010661 [Rhynchophorus ferrugineus]|uniref:Uncharacterized protein n=1 Tax=Rhynchophorus ferrugineus TaxID=354439 RepID=A0A834IUP4_RHYFE|nr:hypothetical protein GWI33_010661 [Rhynchophorus ferrugineus]
MKRRKDENRKSSDGVQKINDSDIRKYNFSVENDPWWRGGSLLLEYLCVLIAKEVGRLSEGYADYDELLLNSEAPSRLHAAFRTFLRRRNKRFADYV